MEWDFGWIQFDLDGLIEHSFVTYCMLRSDKPSLMYINRRPFPAN